MAKRRQICVSTRPPTTIKIRAGLLIRPHAKLAVMTLAITCFQLTNIYLFFFFFIKFIDGYGYSVNIQI